jgi:hypothetical protein
MNKLPSRDRRRNGKNSRKPLRCVFDSKWRKTSSRCKWRTCRVDNFEIKIHKSVEGRLYLICKYTNKYVLVFIYSGV